MWSVSSLANLFGSALKRRSSASLSQFGIPKWNVPFPTALQSATGWNELLAANPAPSTTVWPTAIASETFSPPTSMSGADWSTSTTTDSSWKYQTVTRTSLAAQKNAHRLTYLSEAEVDALSDWDFRLGGFHLSRMQPFIFIYMGQSPIPFTNYYSKYANIYTVTP